MLKGKLVTLRSIEREDLPALATFHNDLEFEVLGGGNAPVPQSLAALQAQFDENVKEGRRTQFVIEADGKVIGECGLRDFNDAHQHCELGIGIGDREYWGRGYGREAVILLCDYAFTHRNCHRIMLTTLASNERAIRAYRACGLVEEGRLREHAWSDGRWQDEIVMGILRDEWEAGRSAT